MTDPTDWLRRLNAGEKIVKPPAAPDEPPRNFGEVASVRAATGSEPA